MIMLRFVSKALVFCAVFALASGLAIYKFATSVAQPVDVALLDQTAVIPNAWRSHELNVNYGLGGSPESLKHNHTHNAQGFKYPRDIAKEKGMKTVRVFAMGGSTLYGWGSEGLPQYGNWPHLANDETITYQLETILNREIMTTHPGWNVEVINAAIIDYNSAFHLIYYNQKIVQYEPDVVIFLDGNNEFFGIKRFNTLDEYRNTAVNVIHSFNERGPYFTGYVILRYLSQYSGFFRVWQYSILNKWLQYEAPTVNKIYDLPEAFDNFDEIYDRKSHDFLRTYAELKAAADFDHVGVALFLGPEMLMENKDLLGSEDLRTRAEVVTAWTSAGTVDRGEFMQRVRAKLPSYFQSIGLPFYDVSQLAAEENKGLGLYIDYTHVTPSGAKVLAQKMAPATEDLVEQAIARRLQAVAVLPEP